MISYHKTTTIDNNNNTGYPRQCLEVSVNESRYNECHTINEITDLHIHMYADDRHGRA